MLPLWRRSLRPAILVACFAGLAIIATPAVAASEPAEVTAGREKLTEMFDMNGDRRMDGHDWVLLPSAKQLDFLRLWLLARHALADDQSGPNSARSNVNRVEVFAKRLQPLVIQAYRDPAQRAIHMADMAYEQLKRISDREPRNHDAGALAHNTNLQRDVDKHMIEKWDRNSDRKVDGRDWVLLSSGDQAELIQFVSELSVLAAFAERHLPYNERVGREVVTRMSDKIYTGLRRYYRDGTHTTVSVDKAIDIVLIGLLKDRKAIGGR